VAGDRPIGPADQSQKATPTGLVPGLGVCLDRGHPDPAGLAALPDALELGDPVEDYPVKAG
jgi:hypothetical protein